VGNLISAMTRKVYRLLDYVANIINIWGLKGNFTEYLNKKINQEDE
jgi:hypothetical protein